MATGVSANKLELLRIAESMAREKGIEPELVFSAMADAIQKAAKARYGAENDINQAVWSLVFGLRVLEIVYMVAIPMAILKLAPQTSVHTCLTHLKSPNRIVWASVPLLFAVAVLNSPLFVENDVNILFTAVNFFIMVYFTIFGAFTGMICKSFGVKCR